MHIPRTNMAATAETDFRPGLEQIFLEHKDQVFRAAYRVTGHAGDAEDVLQTVFLRLVRQERFPEIANLPAYLHRSAVNAALDLLRSRKTADVRTLSLDEEQHHQDAVSPNAAQPATEIRDWLRQALGRLNPRWAEIFVLRFIEDYSNREIAGMMNTSAAVIAVILHRTRARLKKDFKQSARGNQ
jgi:RNA polymerase sigma-70 factor, ECF subfamily